MLAPRIQWDGIPQWYAVSVTVLVIAINGNTSWVVRGLVTCSLCVGDFATYCWPESVGHSAAVQLQLTVSHLSLWSQGYGFKFSLPNSIYVHFWSLRGLSPTQHFCCRQPYPISRKSFLGCVLDCRPTLETHSVTPYELSSITHLFTYFNWAS
jgi:hypothetical protein